MITRILVCFLLILLSFFAPAQVAINNTGAAPDSSAMLDIQSTNKGFYPPRMTWTQIKAIPSPGPGMIAFDTDFGKLRIYNGSKWTSIDTDVPYDKPAGSFKTSAIVSELHMEGLKAVAVDPLSRNVYVTGSVTDNLNGQTVNGISDAVLIAYSETGQRLWTRLFGSSSDDVGTSVVVGPDGGVYVGGYVNGSIDGQPYAGAFDVALIKFNSNGDKLWTRTMGTNLIDRVVKVGVDVSGNLYFLGYTEGAFPGFTNTGGHDMIIAKFSSAGAFQWLRQSNSNTSVDPLDFSINNLGIYITGSTSGVLDGQGFAGGVSDIFVTKYNFSGTRLLTVVTGTSGNEFGQGIVADNDGNFFITGETNGDLHGQSYTGQYPDVFIVKYNNGGAHQWTKLYGEGLGLGANHIAMDTHCNIYLAGLKYNMVDNPQFGGNAVYLRKLDVNGNPLWMQLGGSDAAEAILSFSNFVDDSFYLLGYFYGSYGVFGSQRINNTFGNGNVESFLWKYAE